MTAVPKSRPVERFVEVSSARTVRNAIEMACRMVAPVRVIGRPGTGKSAALMHYTAQFEGVYCECAGFAKDIKGMFLMLLAGFNFYTDERFTSEIADVLYGRLAYDPHYSKPRGPLFVDEWQTLEPPAQRELLRLAETCRLPMVLAGNAERLFTSRTHKTALEQVDSRITAEFTTTGLSVEDCDAVSIDHNVEGKDARELVRRIGAALEFRGLNNVLKEAANATGGRGSVQLRHLELALTTLNAWTRLERKEGSSKA